jgi:hypothetical protein
MNRKARAAVPGLRQETQFTCCATSIAACLQAHGKNQTEADVNKILGASPMSGASWEAILATLQYFGLRGSLVVPATVTMLKQWTDAGTPVIIAWNPEGRPWSHASVVADVTDGPDGRYVHVMDSNIPNPDKTFRILHEDEFCAKWGEKVSDSLIVRRPACAVEREITVEGRQVRASKQRSLGGDEVRSMLASTDRVIARKAGIENGKLDSKLKRLANAYMFQDGLDGNGRFRKATDGYNLALKILGDFGIELGEIVSSHLFSPDSNTLKIDLAFTNPADSFSPVSITNSMLHLSYTRLDNDRFEVLAYLT